MVVRCLRCLDRACVGLQFRESDVRAGSDLAALFSFLPSRRGAVLEIVVLGSEQCGRLLMLVCVH
jgi:hypothetical protein